MAFRLDALGDWIADLDCGHGQHVRHDPPWTVRPWVVTAAGRAAHIGGELTCEECAQAHQNSVIDSDAEGLAT